MYESAKFRRRHKKERVVDWCAMDDDLLERYRKFCKENGYISDRLMNIIITEFIEMYGIKKED
jgi:hypothetical protein